LEQNKQIGKVLDEGLDVLGILAQFPVDVRILSFLQKFPDNPWSPNNFPFNWCFDAFCGGLDGKL
jgi:hypothetical protein